jgi:hypothetical protein
MRSKVFQHVDCRLNGLLANLVHGDRVLAVFARHDSAACSFSGCCVHISSLRRSEEPCELGWSVAIRTSFRFQK